MLKLHIFLLSFACFAFAQVTPNSVTVTATRNSNLQPDQVIFGVFVDTPEDAPREDVIAALQGSGITLANFTSVTSWQVVNGPQATMVLRLFFTLPAAVASMRSTIGLLAAVQKSMVQSKPAFSMSFGVQGTQVSQQAQQTQPCSLPDLVADARAQAQKMAGAASASVGAVLAMTSATVVTDPASSLFAQASLSPVCGLTVKFALSGGF